MTTPKPFDMEQFERDCNAREAKWIADLDRKPGKFRHRSAIRCPACGWASNPGNADLFGLYTEGAHDVYCQACGREFIVHTIVTHQFTSPARVPQ